MTGTTITYLELTDPAQIVAPARQPVGWRVQEVHRPALNERLYKEIGRDFKWTDRLPWTAEEWTAHAARVQTWLLVPEGGGDVAGFYELDVRDGAAEVAIFGLLPAARGLGLGGVLLTHALRRALERAPRVWLHTCTDDDPHALANYGARGLRVYDVVQG